MTVERAEAIIATMHTGVKIAYQHRFCGEKGTILRLDNYAMINIFDDGRYFIQGENIEELVIAFGLIEEAWDPDTWPIGLMGEFPTAPRPSYLPKSGPSRRIEF
jgi:hypothetical protein